MLSYPISSESIKIAADFLHEGKLVAIPTETVYGLGADASNPDAVMKIFTAKGRPSDHPLIVHLANPAQVKDWACDVPDSALVLARSFWPGPLTLILPKAKSVASQVTGGQDTIALRVPAHPVALWLLRHFGGGIAAPSANRFGRISPTKASHVVEELDSAVDCILDGGPCGVGVESTILDLTDRQPTILRPGRITRSQLEVVLQCDIGMKSQHKIRAPGMLAAHYAPQTPALLCDRSLLIDEFDRLCAMGRRVAVLSFSPDLGKWPCEHKRHLPEKPEDYESGLYQALRELDKLPVDTILVERPPAEEVWLAVNDRLGKATL